ncbi:FecCD family ABC transporter permease [Alkalicoccobacillus plakortidis]|uniref:Iron chelate uptake ABC transporter family permease subunit n=1 Tax=Alkalicoccobacillus plakortidis TaxID=444060 RepID=A0ABT0XNH5_9BACI|nr:iron chelate uptake ABC transporter family permease subunit [Alkalicoccobacillus plakortidis]MCM2676888.1 iron chelate uptake ABC transporter family permease subunit [Alkalicoccobacillus plakortidis]
MRQTTIENIAAGRRERRRRWIIVNSLLLVLACMLCIGMLMMGNTIYPPGDVIRVLMGESVDGANFAVNTIRLPRMLAGLFAGIAFGIAGNTFQTMLRNPLANPDILGITAGSSVAALFCILILRTSNTTISIAAVIAALVTVVIIYVLSKGRSFSVGRLILVGIGVQAMLGAMISYLLLIGAQQDIATAFRWLSGSLNGSQMNAIIPLMISVVVCAPIVMILGKHLSILELGEESASSLGLNTDRTRILLILSSVAMIAIATATTGPIAFVAFLSGPIAKRLVGAGYSNVIPAGLVGLNLVLAADLIGQFAFEVRFPVGIITGILGAPYLLYLLIRMNRKGSL